MRARWLALSLLIPPVVVAGWLFSASPDARGEHPVLVEQAIADLLNYNTLYDGSGTGGVLQVDVEQEVITYDCREARVHWDGTHLWIHREHALGPEQLPAMWADRVRDVWDEWRSGFANSAFVVESPVPFDDHAFEDPGKTWHRVELPFPWMAAYLVYVQVMNNGRMGLLSVYHADTHQPVGLGPRWTGQQTGYQPAYLRNAIVTPENGNTNVPLSPETYSPNRPATQPSAGGWRPGAKAGAHGERSSPTWHQLQQFVKLVRSDTHGGLTAGPQLSNRCETASAVYTAPLDVAFAFPDDPDKAALATQAAAQCPNAGFHTKLTVFHHPVAGQRTCATATWRVVNTLPDPDVVLWQHQIDECRNGPSEGRLEYPTELALPVGSDPTGLEVQLQGQVQIQCNQVSAPGLGGIGNVLAGFLLDDYPVLSWPGCYPDVP